MSPHFPKTYVMRVMNADDIETVAGWLQNLDDLSLFDRTQPLPLAKETLRENWKADFAAAKFPSAYWFIVEGSDGAPAAVGGLQSINYVHGDAVLPILVAREARGMGLGLRIAAILLDVAFDRLRLRRVTTFFRSDNLRSDRLTRRVGFREEGRMREAWFVGGLHLDSVLVGLLKEEWYSRRDALRSEFEDSIQVVFRGAESDPPERPHAAAAPLKFR